MKAKIKFLLILLVVAIIGCSQNESHRTNQSNTNHNTFVSGWHNYSIEYPENWSVEKRPDENTVYLIGPKIDSTSFGRDGAFGIKVFVLSEPLTSEYTYEKNMESFETDPIVKGFRIDSKTEILIDGKKAIRVIHSVTVFDTKIISLQYYLAIDKKLFIMGGSIPSDFLGKYENIFDEIVKSMNFK